MRKKEVNEYKPPVGYDNIPARINPPKASRGCSTLAGDLELSAGKSRQPCRPWPAYTHFTNQETIGVRSSR
ncbi:unnamed protein product, partial [Pylaiella littoralis]